MSHPICELKQLPTGRWFCPLCDPDAKETVPLKSRRRCRFTMQDEGELIDKFDTLVFDEQETEANNEVIDALGIRVLRLKCPKNCGKKRG